MFSEDEYKKYKDTVVPRRLRNRLYVSFGIPGQIDCKLIGPETPCFCTHRYGSPVIHILDVHTHTYKNRLFYVSISFSGINNTAQTLRSCQRKGLYSCPVGSKVVSVCHMNTFISTALTKYAADANTQPVSTLKFQGTCARNVSFAPLHPIYY